jgi:HEXXH motif-containing protein
MIAEDLAYEGFASPEVGSSRDLLETLVVNHGMQTLEAFVERHGTRLDQRGSGLVPALKNWLQREAPYDAVWNTAFGDMYAALLSNQPDEVDRSAAALALRAHAFGLEGDWQFQLDSPASFMFDRWMLPLGDAVRVSTTGNTVLIDTRTTDGWRQSVFQRDEDGWGSDDAQSIPVFDHPGLHCNIVPIECLPAASPAQRLVKDLYDAGTPNDADMLLRTCKEAADLISEFAGIYLPWVSESIKGLIPLPPRPNVLHSASGNLAPGLISVTNQPLRCALAEQLVHEATHQHLYILKRLGPLEDGTDETLYYSPFRKMGRPIFYILFAYHAFANVLLFYRMARRNGLPDDEPGVTSARTLEEDLQSVEEALMTTKALTPLGRALWEPLHERLVGEQSWNR